LTDFGTFLRDGTVRPPTIRDLRLSGAVAKDGKSRMVTTSMTDAKGKKHVDKAYYDKQ